MFLESNKKKFIKPAVFAVVVACAVVAVLAGLEAYGKDMDRRGVTTVESALTRASAQCYALEGRYAPSLEYLSDNYGLRIDADKYTVHYIYQGANIPPDIKVFLGTEQPAF